MFQSFRKLYLEYFEGLKDGKYFKVEDNGYFSYDRSKELILKNKVRDFFISGRLLINNFAKSGIIDDQKIILNDLLIVSDKNFEKNKNKFLKNSEGLSYEVLFQIIENSRNGFLSEFNQVRAEFEHNNYQIEKFKVVKIDGKNIVIEPKINNYPMFSLIDNYYSNILYFIEVLMAYYYGLNKFERTKGFFTLFERKEFDYSELKYRFVIKPRDDDKSLILLLEWDGL